MRQKKELATRRQFLKITVGAFISGTTGGGRTSKLEAKRVRNSWSKPERFVGRIRCDGRWRGTGFLIGPRIVLTAAHIIYNPKKRKAKHPRWLRKVKFYPGMNRLPNGRYICPFGGFTAVKYRWDSEWPEIGADPDYLDKAAEHDWMLLILKHRPRIGYLGYSSEVHHDQGLWTFGYPSCGIPQGSLQFYEMTVVEVEDKYLKVKFNEKYHSFSGDVDMHGMSGGPLLFWDWHINFYAVRGFHLSSVGDNLFYYRRIDEALDTIIKKYRKL